MVRRERKTTGSLTFIKRPISAAVQAAIYSMMLATSVQAAPTGGQVVGGAGSINQNGATTTINQASQNMAINWQSYNVNSNETVNYKQPNASSISLNRILSNDGSTIAGHINANGQVILVNPNGILFTPTAVINVGGIIASGMDISPDNFMNGKYIFNEVNGKKGTVVNTGTINASLGGNVALVGKKVENDGLIAAKLGTVTLAAGKQAVLTFDNGGVLGVRVSKAVLQKDIGVDPAVLNKGKINAAGGKVLLTASTSQDVFSQAVNSGNIQQATSVVVNADGSFTLGAGADTVNTGSIDTSAKGASQNGGQIVMLGKNVTSSGSLKADAADGNGGNIELHSTDTTLITQNSITSAQSKYNGTGGIVEVLGDKVGLFDQSTVDVSGANGGGQALIGGDEHGANANIQDATDTIVNPGANIYADGLDNGNGGKVIVWSNANTYFGGSIFARGGALSGNGGFVESSSKGNLTFVGTADRSANNGQAGMLLLDPKNVYITTNGNDPVSEAANFSNTPSNTTITPSDLLSALANGPVTLDATESLNVYSDVTVPASGFNRDNSSYLLTLQSGGTVDVGHVSGGILNGALNLNNHPLTVVAGSSACGVSSCGNAPNDITVWDIISSNSDVILHASDNINIYNAIAAKSIKSRAGNNIVITRAFQGGGIVTTGSVTATGNGGQISLTGNDTSLTDTVAPETPVSGDLIITGNITTNNGAFTANTTLGYFDNSAGGTISTGSGNVTINTSGNGTSGSGTLSGGALLGNISTTTGNLSVNTTGGAITQSTSTGLGIGGQAFFSAGSNNIDLESYTNSLQSEIGLTTINANNATLRNNSSNTLLDTTVDGDTNVGGDLIIYAQNNLEVKNSITASSETLNFGQSGNTNTFLADSGASFVLTGAGVSGPTVNGGAGNDTFTLKTIFDGTLNGGGTGAINTIEGPTPATSNWDNWVVSGQNSGTLTETDGTATSAGTVSFNNIQNLTGGQGQNEFIVKSGGSIGTLTGGNGVNGFYVYAAGIGTADTGTNSSTVGSIIGANAGDTASIYSKGVVNGDITMGSGINTINVAGTVGGVINGGGNNASVLNILSSVTSAPTVNLLNAIPGQSPNNSGSTYSVYQVGTINNQFSSGTLYGPNTQSAWTINATPSVSWTTPSSWTSNFSGFTDINGGNSGNTFAISGDESINITAGTAGDTFKLGSSYTGALNGNSGADIFAIQAANVNATITDKTGNNDTLKGLTGTSATSNTWTISSDGGGSLTNGTGSVSFSGMQTLDAGSAGDAFQLSGGKITTINGGGTTGNIIIGPTVATFWTITGTGAGTVGTTKTGTDLVGQFTDIQTLQGGTGTNTLQGSNSKTNWYVSSTDGGSVALNSKPTTPLLSFTNMQNLVGGTAGNNFYFGINPTAPIAITTAGSLSGTLDGGSASGNSLYAQTNGANTWVFKGAGNSGTVATGGNIYVNFSEIQKFIGAGTDTANLSGLSNLTVDPTNYLGFKNLIGSSSDTLTGHAGLNSTWLINGPNSGVLTLGNYPQWTFSGFATLSGSDASSSTAVTNQFSITTGGSFAGTINGGGNSGANASTNILSALGDSGATNVWQINASNSTLVQTASGATAITTTFNGMQNINDGTQTPGADNNTLTVNGGATLNNVVFGNGSNNITVGLSNDTTSSAINSIITGTGANTITVNALGQVTSSGQSITSGDASTTAVSNITVHGAVGGSIATAGSGANVVTVSGTVGGVISGGGANSTLNITATGDQSVQLGSTPSGANYTGNNFGAVNANNSATGNTLVSDNSATNTWTVTGTKNDVNNGTIDTVFTNFTNLQGGAGYNDFTINAGINSVTANGNSGNSITVGAGSVSGTITAQGTGTNLITVTGNVAGLITGGGANTTLDVTNSGKNVQIGTTSIAGAPTTNYEITNIGQLTANAGNALIWGSAGGSNWTVSATGNAGKVGNTNFTGISNLWGGAGNNTFNINGNIGNITAAGKVDKVNINAGTTGSIALSGSTNTINVSGVVNGKASATGAGSNTINIDGSVNGLVSAIGTGGGASNTVNVNQGGFVNDNQMTNNAINVTGNGTNVVNLAGTVTGIINGNSQNTANNTINITAKDKIVQLGTSIVSGEAPDYMVNDFGNINAINDSASTYQNGNVLIGYTNNAANWTIDNINKGYLTGGGVTTSFTNFGNLVGGAKGDTFTLNNDGNTTHGELTGWQDGSKSSVTTFTINSKSLFTYDLLGAPSTYPSPIYNDPTTDTVSVYGFNKTGGKNTIGLSLNNNNVWVIHVDAANSNTTDADLYINGSSTISTTFSGSFIKGGAQDDTFIWKSGALAGGIYGGSSGTNSLIIPSTNTGPKTILLGAAGSAVTTGTSSVMPVLNLQYMVANNTATNTIVGSNLSSIGWSIQSVSLAGIVTNNTSLGGTLPTNTSINSGIVDDGTTSTTFTGFGIVQGGAQGGNTYTLASGGGLSGYINGNGAGDNLVLGSSLNATPMTVKLLNSASGSSPNTSTIAVYNVGKVTGTDTTGASNDTLVAMSGSNFTDNWAINDVNGGTVDNGTGIGTQSVNFVGFGNLVGNAGNDQFDVSGAGSMSGVIHANGGTDSLNVALTGSENGQVKFLADKGAIASVAVTGTAGDGVFTPSVAGSAYDQIQYTTGGNSYDVNYTKANNITDSVAANSLTVNGASTSSSISLSSPSGGQADAFDFSVNGHTSVSETGKSQLNVTGLSGNDTIALTTGLDLTGMGVDLSAQNISQTTGVLAADSLNLDGVGTAGSANNPFNIAVANLNTSNHGAVYLNQQGDLTLFGMNSSGLLDITSDGNISSSAPLVSTGNLDIASTNGDINLSGSNQLGGMITLSGGNIAINNTTDLQLGNITATGNSLNISTTGASNISQATGTAINNQNATGKAVMTLDAQQGGNITLANAGNQINILHVKDGGAVKFNAKSSIGLDIVNANSVDLTTTDGIFDAENGAVTNISANSVMLSAVNGIGGGTVDYNNSNGKFTIDPSNPVYLSTSNLSVLNNNANPNSYKAPIVLQNNGNVTITDLRNNGNIYLYNKGDISLAVAPKVTNTPNRGAIDANYGGSYDKSSGAYTNTVYYGNVALIGTGSKSITTQGVGVSEADITAQNLYVQSFSKFGLKTAPIRLDIHNQFSLLTTDTGAVAYPFGRPANVTTSADLVTYSGVNILSGEQLINIQSLGDVDPAIFTAVRNYDHEDVAILLPPDQRLGDDQECNNKDKKCKKRHQAMN